jgi:hypothetical protein
MKKTDQNQVYTVNKETVFREIEGQILLLRPNDRFLYTLNEPGKFIWLQIIKRKSIYRIARSVAKQFKISNEQATTDVLKFIADLKRKNIINKEEKK